MPNWWSRFAGRSTAPAERKAAQSLMTLTSLGAASWSRRSFAALAQEGFVKNPVVNRCVRLIAESATRVLDHAAGRDTLEFALPHSAAALEVGDAVALAGQGEGPFEITEIRDGAVRRITARAIPPVVEAAIVSDRPRSATAVAPPARALPLLAAAHLPAEPDSSASRLLLAASASPWPGRVTVNDETTGAQVARLGANASLGELTSPLGIGPAATWDRGNAVTVQLYSGHLASADDEVVLAGGNRIAVETDAGWEVIGFAEATLLSPGIYRLTRLLRGQEGTAVGAADAGNRIVVLDARAAMTPVPPTWLGETVPLRAYAGSSDPTGAAFNAELGLDPVLPLAPVHLHASRDAGSGDIGFGWVRRSRADTQSWTPAEIPHDNLPEAYRLTILDGAVPVRTIDLALPAATYTAAEQAADFGAPPTGFDFTVAQLSPLYGPGHAASGAFDG